MVIGKPAGFDEINYLFLSYDKENKWNKISNLLDQGRMATCGSLDDSGVTDYNDL
jgi:hypothetical protein